MLQSKAGCKFAIFFLFASCAFYLANSGVHVRLLVLQL
jgi:hypothetical protein